MIEILSLVVRNFLVSFIVGKIINNQLIREELLSTCIISGIYLIIVSNHLVPVDCHGKEASKQISKLTLIEEDLFNLSSLVVSAHQLQGRVGHLGSL